MNKEQLMQMAEKYQSKADMAEQAYQETGITRYDTQRRKSEDLAEALRAAANASEDHNKLISLRGEIASLAVAAKNAMNSPEDIREKELEHVAKEIVATASIFGIVTR